MCSCPCSCLCSCSCSCSCRARARARARAVLLLRLEPVVLVVPVVVLVRGPRAWSSLSTLCRLLVFFLLACLSSCWKSSAGRTPTRQRATFASKVMRSPARRAYLPQRSSQKIHHLAAQSSRAHRPDGANFPPSFFFRAAGLCGRGDPAQAEPAAGRLASFFDRARPSHFGRKNSEVSGPRWGTGRHRIAVGSEFLRQGEGLHPDGAGLTL